MPVLLYNSEKKRSWIRGAQIDNLRGMLGIMRIYLVKQGVGTKTDETVIWFGLIERTENKIGKRVDNVQEVGSNLVGQQQKRWINSMNECFKKEKT